MKTTHAPGPWHYVDCGEGLHAIHDQPDRRGRHEQLATVYTKDNARLIAAAPELLAALEALDALTAGMNLKDGSVGGIETGAKLIAVAKQARAAIAKAGK